MRNRTRGLGRRRSLGITLIEVLISATIVAVVILGAASALRNQVDVVGHVANNDYTSAAAQTALWRIRNELLSAVQSPNGVTAAKAPVYAVVAPDTSPLQFSSITWRPVIGKPDTNDPAYSDYYLNPTNWTGCLSSNGILYSNKAKRLWVDKVTFAPNNVLRLDTLDNSGTDSAHSEIIAGSPAPPRGSGQNLTEFRLYQAESCNTFVWNATNSPAFAPGATSTTYLVGIYLRLEKTSVNPNDYDKVTGQVRTMTSNYDNKATAASDLHMAVLIAPETLTQTAGKPFVGP